MIAAGKVLIDLQAGSTNRLSDATTYTYPSGDRRAGRGAVLGAADLTIAGTGTLTVTGNAYDGIASKDGLVIDGRHDHRHGQGRGDPRPGLRGDRRRHDHHDRRRRRHQVDNDEAANAGYVSIAGGTVGVDLDRGDAVDGDTDVIITGGKLTTKSGGGSGTAPGTASTKGLKAGVLVVISEGTNTIDASDDGINSDADVTVDGGTTTIATGDDGVHAEDEHDGRRRHGERHQVGRGHRGPARSTSTAATSRRPPPTTR